MKRNVISLLLALVLVFAVTVALAPTAEATVAAPDVTHADHTGWKQASGTSIKISESANYYLGGALGTAITFTAPESGTIDVTICLNGKTLRGNNPINGVPAGVNLTICDCSANKTGLVTCSQKNNNSQAIKVSGGTVNLVGVTVDGNFFLNSVDNLNRCVYMTAGEVNMWDTTLMEGTYSSGHGGNVYMEGGVFNMYSGTITNGNASGSSKHGGNVAVNSSSAVFHMEGGIISGGTAAAKGGNVCLVTGSFEMTGGTITGGTAGTYGGNVSANTSSTFTMNGADAVISYGVATSGGGNMHRQGEGLTTLTAGTITKGGIKLEGETETVTNTYGGNIYLESSTINHEGATVTEGKVNASSGRGGNVYVAGGIYNLTAGLLGQEANRQASDVNNAFNGGNVYVAGGTFNMGTSGSNDTTRLIKNGKANQGGNVWIEGNTAEFNMYSGEMFRGYANNAGNIRVNKGTLNIFGGHIHNGYTTGNGGNMSVANDTSSVNMYGGKISNGYAAKGGEIFFASGAAVTVTGGTIGPVNYLKASHAVEWNTTAGTLKVGGTADIKDVYLNGTKIQLADTALATGASIGISAEEGYEFLTTADTTLGSYFYDVNDVFAAVHNGTGYALSVPPVVAHTHCWCNGIQISEHTCDVKEYAAAGTTTVVTFTAENTHIYLDDNAQKIAFDNSVEAGGEYYLCLNGKRLKAQTPVEMTKAVTLHICDCQGGGRLCPPRKM